MSDLKVKKRRKKSQRSLFWTLLNIIAVTLTVLIFSLPYLVQEGLPPLLAHYKIALTLDGVEGNLSPIKLVLKGVRLESRDQDITAEKVILHPDTAALWEGRLRLGQVTITGGKIGTHQNPVSGWIIDGTPLTELGDEYLAAIPVDTLEFHDLRVVADVTPVHLHHLLIKGVSGAAEGGAVRFRLAGEMDGIGAIVKGRGWPFAEQPEMDMDVEVTDLDLKRILDKLDAAAPWLTGGIISGRSKVTVNYWPEPGILEGRITGKMDLTGLVGEDPKLLFRDTDLLWNGEATLTYTPSLQTGGFSFRGTIDIPNMSLSPKSRERAAPLMKLQFTDATWDGRLKWLKINQPLAELELDGDSEISRLVFLPHDRPG
ncbi:MAG: hypothetical protein GY731_11260, partial [Gammaproteobacteria bacterium]|nr:hypothetical protein [Gammaproteobacteria bacterium]